MASDPDTLARNRYFIMTFTRIAAAGGAMLGLVLMGRATQWPQQLLGGALLLSALYVMGTVPRAMARRWRTPRD